MPWSFFAFIGTLSFFHSSEYFITWVFNREILSRESWLINNRTYVLAMTGGCFEYAIECLVIPALKFEYPWINISRIGLGMVIFGEALRKTAQITAKHNFTHQIQTYKRPTHNLVTHGVYAWCRHPGYLGSFVWLIGTQVLLINPICTMVFAYMTWDFFATRIPYEEKLLCKMFPYEYASYAARTRIWIPGIPAGGYLE